MTILAVKDQASMMAVPFSLIPEKEVDPLWLGWVLRRHVTMLVAPGGTGKGLLTIDMGARVTKGKGFPDEPEGTVREPEAVVIVAPEDDANEAVAWRLKAAGADLSLVFNLTVFPDGSQFTLPGSVKDGSLKRAMDEIEEVAGVKVGLVIIDPLFAVVARPLTTNPAARAVIDPLEHLANESGAAVVLTHHTVKSGKTAGSKGLTDAVRCVLRIERSGDGAARVLSVEKSNNMGDSASIRYIIAGEGGGTCLVWPAEVEQLAAKLSSRGYEIRPDLTAAPAQAEAPGELVELFESGPGGGADSLGRFGSSDQAKAEAEKSAHHKLAWKAGPIEGSSGAATEKSGEFAYYSVIPVN